jgi:hypothetical protein
MLNQKNKNLVVLNTPANFDLSIFDNIKKTENYHKVIFLINQIDHFTNSKGVFKINKKAYYQMLGINNSQLNKLLGLLINEAKLVEHLYTGNSFTGRLSEYKSIEPFDIETSIKHQYDVTDRKCPEFIKKWVANDYRVLPTEKSSYVKPDKEAKIKSKSDSNLIKQLQVQNEQLIAEIASLKAQLSNSNISIGEVDAVSVVVSNDEFKSAKSDNKFNKNTPDVNMCEAHLNIENEEKANNNLDVYTLKLTTKTYYFMNHKIILNATTDEDDEAILINKLQDHKDGDDQSLVYNGKTIKFNKGRVANEIMIQLVA